MKSVKEGNLLRLIAIFLVAVTLVLLVGFAADGWQGTTDNEEQNQAPENTQNPNVPTLKLPDHISYLTGLKTVEEKAKSTKLCYLLNPLEALHGIPSAELVIEIPVEMGGSRLIAYIDENVTVEPKIGSITKTRDYISNIASFFGGLLITAGNDDSIEYDSIDVSDYVVDLSGHVGYYYTENQKNVYTNRNLIEALLLSQGLSKKNNSDIKMPFTFNGYFENSIKFTELARTLTIEYSKTNTTKFSYSADGAYTLTKNGVNTVDPQTGGLVSFENVFVLFTDTATYEKIDGTSLVCDTNTSGVGYYFTEGTACNIRWYCDDSGALVFLNDTGTKLTANRGSSYVAYVRASEYGKIVVEP